MGRVRDGVHCTVLVITNGFVWLLVVVWQDQLFGRLAGVELDVFLLGGAVLVFFLFDVLE